MGVLAVCALVVGVLGGDSFKFAGLEYQHRFSKGDLHEWTPTAQADLNKWKDMVTLNVYRHVKSGEDLAKAANSVLETYKANQAVVVRTNSVPRTDKAEAEHLIVVLFPRPDLIEASFARFYIRSGFGYSLVYGHRVYGKKAGNDMSTWLKANGPSIEKSLMAMVPPKPPAK